MLALSTPAGTLGQRPLFRPIEVTAMVEDVGVLSRFPQESPHTPPQLVQEPPKSTGEVMLPLYASEIAILSDSHRA
jgi:hypothetical protein